MSEGGQTSLEDARSRIATLEREAKLLGADGQAALLFHQIGLLWEDPLNNPRNAAVAFQNAFRLSPRFVGNLQAARRIFADVGNWQMVLQLLDAELEATQEAKGRAGLLLDKAAILEERLGRPEEAAAVQQAVLDLEPLDLAVLIQLGGISLARGDVAAQVRVHRLLARAVRDPRVAAQELLSAGLLLEEKLEQPEQAAGCWREAFALDRRDPVILAALKRIAGRDGRDEELLAVLAAEADLLGPEGGPAYLELSRVYERLGRTEDALAALRAARRIAPKEPLVLSAQAALFEAAGRAEELADVLLVWADEVQDEAEAAAIQLRLAALYEDRLRRDEQALQCYRALLARVPTHAAALAGLGRLHARLQDWTGLVAVYDAELGAAPDPTAKAATQYRAAEVLEIRLGRIDDAIARYRACLVLAPGFLPARQALSRIFERSGRWADLAALLEQELLLAQDPDQTLAQLTQVAQLYEDRVGDTERALDSLRRALEIRPGHLPTLRHIIRLTEKLGRWPDLVSLLGQEAELVSEPKAVVALHQRAAEVLDERLRDRAGAIAVYERVLTVNPTYLPALASLGRLYAQDGRWPDLVRMYRSEAAISPQARAVPLLLKIGELQETRLGDSAAARATYDEVLERAPGEFQALRALNRIHRSAGAWEALVEVLVQEAATRTDPRERADALYEAAALREEPLGQLERALSGYEEVLKLSPGHRAALRALERVHSAQRRTPELLAVLDRVAQTAPSWDARIGAYLKLARLYLDRLDEPQRAAQVAEAALQLDAGNLAALRVLERVREGEKARVAELRERIAERVSDVQLGNALRLTSALQAEVPGTEGRRVALERAFAADPADPRLAFALERELRQAGDGAALLRFCEQRLAAAGTAEERLGLLLRVAELAETRAQDPRRALEAHQAALLLAPDLLPAIQGSRRAWLGLGQLREARDAWEAEGRASRDPDGAAAAFVAAARISAQLGEADAAIAAYRRALDVDPLHPAAGEGVEELLAQRGGAAELAALHERRGAARLLAGDATAAAIELFQAVQLWLDGVRDEERALAALERVLAAVPGHPEALELKGELALEQQRWKDAADAFSERIQHGGEPEALAGFQLVLGRLYEEHLGDSTRAAAHLQSSLAGSPRNAEALERLARVHTASRNWTGAADSLKRLLELEEAPAARARHALALAQVVEEGFGDAVQATALYRTALELSPGNVEIVERLSDIAERSGDVPALAQLLEQQIEGTQDPVRAARLERKLGDLCARSLGDVTRAVQRYRRALELDPTFVEAYAALAELLDEDPPSAELAVDAHRAMLRVDTSHLESLHALFRRWETEKQLDRAFCVAGVLVFLRAATEREGNLHLDHKGRLPADPRTRFGAAELALLHHPGVNSDVVGVLRAIGDELSKIYPPDLEALGVDARADRLRADHPVHRAIRLLAEAFGVRAFHVYQARRGLAVVENTDPLSVCVGQDVVRRYNLREQKFLFGRAVLQLFNKTAVLTGLTTAQVADLLGAALRAADVPFTNIGQPTDEQVRVLRKTLSRRALRALARPARALAGEMKLDLGTSLDALLASANRAGLLMAGDVAVGLGMVLREDPGFSDVRAESAEAILAAVRQRHDLQALISFAVSEELFLLRQRIGPALSGAAP